MLPKTNFPNSSPSSVRAVLNLRWAELTIELVRVKNGLRNSPRTAHADAATRKKTCAAPWEIYRCEGLLLGKKVILVVVGAIIGTHYYKKGGLPFGLPHTAAAT
jgi:hypothetical protein